MGTKCWRGEQYKEHKHNFVEQTILSLGKIAKKEER